jgi:hypothetical protein
MNTKNYLAVIVLFALITLTALTSCKNNQHTLSLPSTSTPTFTETATVTNTPTITQSPTPMTLVWSDPGT